MKRKISCAIAKKKKTWQLLSILSVLFFTSIGVNAQVTIGGGITTSSSFPIASNWGYNYTQQIFLKSEINATGNITSITFTPTTTIAAGNFNTSKDWVVYLGHTNKTAFASNTDWVPVTGLTQVFNGVVSFPAALLGAVTITFTTPFAYNNIDNLVVAIDENTPDYGTVVSWKATSYGSNNRGIYYRSDNTNPNPTSPPTGTRLTTLSDVVLGGIAQACPSPTALTSVVNSATTATLGWATLTNGGNDFEIKIQLAGAGVPASSGTAVSGTSYSDAVLTANTNYEFYVRKVCGVDGNSGWVGPKTFSTPVSCFVPTALTGTPTSVSSATLSWVSPTASPGSGYQWQVRTTGAGGSGATGLADSGLSSITTATTVLLTANTSYKLYVRSNCGSGDFSTWSESGSFFTGYCMPASNATSLTYISSFSTTGSITNISNLASGYTAGGYQNNYASTTVTSYAAGVINTDISIVGGTTGVAFWVDWNKNFVFETSERVINSAAYLEAGSYTASINVPAGTLNGEYRLRIKTDYNAASPDPCTNGGTRTETEDYKITIVTQPTDTPDYFGLQSPVVASTQPGISTTVYGQVYEAGLTDVEPGLSGQATGIVAWIGISPAGQNTNPNTWTTWTPATFNAAYVGNNDEYQLAIGANLAPGTYYYATRYQLNFGPYVYGGIDTAGIGNTWDGTTFNSGVLTINPTANDECSGAVALTLGTQIVTSNAYATKSPEPVPTCGDFNFATTAKDIWYSVVVPANVSRLDIETTNNSDTNITDKAIQAYRGVCGSLVSIECDDDDSPDGLFSLLNLTALTPGETIYVRAWGYNGSGGSFKIKASVPACGIETRWDGTAWSNGNPVAGIVAVINGNYSGPGFESCALDIIGTSQVTFTSGSNLIVNGLVNVASTASMTLESNANLVQVATGTNIGNITVKRESAQLVRLDHTLWSSPVATQNLYAFSPNTLTNRFYVYNTPTNTYVTTGISATTNFVVGKGYGVRAPNDHSTTPATWMGSFTGNPNNGSKSFTLVTTGTGFNLVGNPYPSVIDASLFVAANSARINGTLYFYAHTLTMSPSGTFPTGTNYALWNATGQTAASVGTSGVPALVPNGKIQVGQGFFVKSTASGSVSFTNAMREASNGNQFFRLASEVQTTSETEKHRLWLNLTNAEGTTFNQVLIGYVAGATQEVDNLYDGLSFGNEGSALSSRLNNEDFTIQGRALPFNPTDVVPLGLTAITPGNYTISLSDKDGLFAGDQNVYVKDNENGSVNNIKIAPYTFTSEAGTFNNRFEIVYQVNLSNPENAFTSNSVVAYVKNAQLNIQTKGNSMKAVSVFDVRGRLIFQQSGINAADFTAQGLSAQNQVLLVQVTSENGEVATVKVIF
ncbi:GEVED domain-containing protein [Flavobacterium macacae]|uniref:T9SS sorting signal type C domain-containing protein n=1 Tax=Flavobacterium macacae TaxID=2488993 RepID=A0A3P3WA25_9FLAO|nr:GEVED domain-containing protein [Flavobacterium macacae]RRJ90479.1 T9SS sorting signal type C domain-containing protein [Flavobacterium macacae]